MPQIIPLTQAPNQTFTVQLTVDGNPLTLAFQLAYLAMSGWWQLQVTNVQGVLLVASIPLITGYYPAANMLAQYGYLQIGSAYLLNTGNSPDDYPGMNDLVAFSLLWGDTE
jgi:ABC-type multidrug transport system permease subunit